MEDKNIIAIYKNICELHRVTCRQYRKTTGQNIDDFQYGMEFAYIQFLNLMDGEKDWDWKGKHFDEVDKEREKYEKPVEISEV